MQFSKIDTIYRSALLTKYFIKGWGNPHDIQRLVKFRRLISKKGQCYKLVPEQYPVDVTKDYVLDNMRIIEGFFISPFEMYFPDLLPHEVKKAYFQMLFPLKWKSRFYRPVCLHMAGTGDHFFWRRRQLMAKPLLTEAGVGSIILENPFYGLRKPKKQVRSVLHNVSDIFVMGGCLMMEAIALFHWCIRNGLGPLGVTGISMGGHMASLAASSWPYPVVLVPCLSWSTASSVFTEGVMSKAINWKLLKEQLEENDEYRSKISSCVSVLPEDIYSSRSFQNYSNQLENGKVRHQEKQLMRDVAINSVLLKEKDKGMLINRFLNRGRYLESFESLSAHANFNRLFGVSFRNENQSINSYQEALNFMKGIMDEFTHLSNYAVPFDTSLVINVCALNDGYVPRNGVTNLAHIWPDMEVRCLKGGHITAFLFHQKEFRRAIIDGFNLYKKKYL